jgi:hypothetical protein
VTAFSSAGHQQPPLEPSTQPAVPVVSSPFAVSNITQSLLGHTGNSLSTAQTSGPSTRPVTLGILRYFQRRQSPLTTQTFLSQPATNPSLPCRIFLFSANNNDIFPAQTFQNERSHCRQSLSIQKRILPRFDCLSLHSKTRCFGTKQAFVSLENALFSFNKGLFPNPLHPSRKNKMAPRSAATPPPGSEVLVALPNNTLVRVSSRPHLLC